MGVLDLLRDAMPGVAAARVGYQRGQQERADRAETAEQRRLTALRQKMQDERDAEWHRLRMQTGQAALEPKPVVDEWEELDDTEIPTLYNPRTGETKPLTNVRRRARAADVGERGTWQPDPNVPGLYVHSGTGATRRIGSTENPGAAGASAIPPSPRVQQQLRNKIGVVAGQIDDTRSELNAADDDFEPDEARVARLRARADSLNGVRDSLAGELVRPSTAPAAPRARDNLSPLQADYDAAAAALQQELARAGTDQARQRAARERYARLLQRIAAAEQQARTGR